MIINMVTIAVRTTQYIDRTLESLASSDGRDLQVNLILGSYDTSHVEKYRGTHNIVPWDDASEAQARRDWMRHNCNLNAIRSLRYGDAEFCVCIEDDIRFEEDWYQRLLLTIEEIGDKDYVLNLGQGKSEPIGARYGAHSGAYLCGAQAIFYPSKRLRTTIADFVQTNIGAGMNDALVGRYAKTHAALYSTIPVLIGHIGQVSSFSQPKPPKPEVNTPAGEVEGKSAAGAPAAKSMDAHHAPNRAAAPRARVAVDREREARRDRAALLVALLRADLGTGPMPDPARLAACDLAQFAPLATRHGVGPIVYSGLYRLGAGSPPEWPRKLKPQFVHNVFHAQIARAALDEVGAAFHAGEIPVILAKSAALLCGLDDGRHTLVLDKLDLLVRENCLGRAADALQKLGLQRLESVSPVGPVVYAWPARQSLRVKLHTALVDSGQPYVVDLDGVWAAARPLPGAKPNVLLMSPEHELADLCLDFERGMMGVRALLEREDWLESLVVPGARARLLRLYQIARVLQDRSDTIDWNAFAAVTRRWGIERAVEAPLELARRTLGVEPPAHR